MRIGELVTALLYMRIYERRDLAEAHGAGRQDLVDFQVSGLAREYRDDLLETAAVLDALALCHGHGSYLPRPYQEDSDPVPRDVELRTDASDVAGLLVDYDLQHGTGTTGGVPAALEDGCTEAERDAIRAYARGEWIASQERWPD
ncbi:hypothetical protein [Streptomyces yunnanensis]|uniref:Uncharacterized protein n=1 Tax=Streptomyces yunnanensis TaxID=156453 RepID=A0A9X8QUP3_9ACTN|nr:hypothetical protein [Streptomyces yunnanensis]SHM25577.1 hypothetical protein SAMN05216268_109270 [Streptomyces yunnanensis]